LAQNLRATSSRVISSPKNSYTTPQDSSFSRKRSKKRSFCFAETLGARSLPRSGTTGVWGLAPKKKTYLTVAVFFFQGKEVVLFLGKLYMLNLKIVAVFVATFLNDRKLLPQTPPLRAPHQQILLKNAV
jgi:hypothetical protein